MEDLNIEEKLKDYIPGRIAKAGELLSEKYGEDFEILNYGGQQMFEDFYKVTAAADDGLCFNAYISTEGSGLSDSYAARKLARKYSDMIARNLDGIHGYVYVYSSTPLETMPLKSADITIEEFRKLYPDKKMNVSVFVCAENESADRLYDIFSGMFAGAEDFSGILSLYFTKEETLAEIQHYIETNTGLYNDFKEMTLDDMALRCKYTDGKLSVTKEEFTAKAGERL